MKRAPHLLVALTGHGFGHAAQACTVVRALRERVPGLRVTLQATLPQPVLADLFGEPFDLVREAADPGGFVMTSPFDVDVEASADAYAAFHQDWPARVRAEAERIVRLSPDVVLSDVAYLPIEGAARAGIPAYALCSLNWADLYRHYCGHRPEASRVHEEILSAYARAEAFLVAEPGMEMSDLANTRRIGPCARIGIDRREEIRRLLDLGPATRLILVAVGGIDWRVDLKGWHIPAGTHLIVHAADVPERAGMTDFRKIGRPMIDVLRASDAVVSKMGYGTMTEAACNGTGLVYAIRDDWPEAPCGYEWASRNMRAVSITRRELTEGTFSEALDRLLAQPRGAAADPTGGHEAAGILLPHFVG